MTELEMKISRLIIDSLNLEGIAPGDINPTEPLFGDGLGLDSIDALELGVAIKETFGISIDSKDEQLSNHFASVRNLASYVSAQTG
ncbi:MAG: phosphopantetheine-binding protein [Pseudomonadota bacterium]